MSDDTAPSMSRPGARMAAKPISIPSRGSAAARQDGEGSVHKPTPRSVTTATADVSTETGHSSENQHHSIQCVGASPPALSPTLSCFEVISDAEIQLAPALANVHKYNAEDLASTFTQLSIPDEYDDSPFPSPTALAEMEATAGSLADSLHHMLGTMTANLHAISGKTRVCVEAYSGAVDDVGTNVDETVQGMYDLILHCENISHSMRHVYAMADQLKSIKATLTIFEKMVN